MKKYVIPVLAVVAACLAHTSSAAGEIQCQILDNDICPIYGAELALVTGARFGDYGDSGLVELSGYWEGPYFRDILLGGDIGVSFDGVFTFFTSSADIHLPSQLAALAIDVDYVLRYSGGTSVKCGISPGIYSDLGGIGGNSLDFPMSVAMIQAFNPDASGIVGMQIRPRFQTKVMPIIGVDWQVADLLRVSAMLPESRLTWYVDRYWSAHVGFEWNNMSYALNESGDFDREQMEIEDFRLHCGVTHHLSDEIQLTGEIGSVIGRGVEFREDAEPLDSSLEVENAVLMSIAIGGPF